MFTQILRQSFRRQEGQALILAALMVLVMSIAVLTTVNIGHTVHERVRLQNTADAAAYSMAAMEARAFNFYAYANRTQVSHYVSAMMWHSLISVIYGAEAFFTDLYGFMKTLNPCAGKRKKLWIILCPIIEVIPYIGQIIKAINKIITLYKTAFLQPFQRILKAVNPDRWLGKYVVPAHRVFNGAMYFTSQAVMMSASTHVTQTTQGVLDANDTNLNSMASQLATGIYSQCLFSQAHSEHAGGKPLAPGSWKNPFGALDVKKYAANDPVARAKRAMGGITNATRYACDRSSGGTCPERFNTSRRLGDILPLPDSLGLIRDLLNNGVNAPGLLEFQKMGQTRMLSATFPAAKNLIDAGRSAQHNYIRDWNDNLYPWGMMAQGDNMGADDLYWLKLGPAEVDVFVGKADNPLSCNNKDPYTRCFGDNRKDLPDRRAKTPYARMFKPSVWALNNEDSDGVNGGVHWRVHYPQNSENWRRHKAPKGPERQVGVHEEKVCVLELFKGCWFSVSVYTANVRPAQDGNHPWGGVTPFMHFEPGQYSNKLCNPAGHADMNSMAPRTMDFNQPSAWVALNKSPEEIVNRDNKDGTGTNAPALLNDEGKVKFAFTPDSEGLEMLNNRKKFLSLVEGMNVISRGQSYYHRPGNWTEQPNFFNPYWRPRLASVFQGREQLPVVGSMINALPGAIQGFGPKVITH